MKKFFGARGLSAVAGLFLVAASNPATAAPGATAAATTASTTVRVAQAAQPKVAYLANGSAVRTAAAIPTPTTIGQAIAATPAALAAQMAATTAVEAASLHRNGWPLYALADRYSAGAPLDEQANCMAVAVYHEARGETLEGQLAVARVIMNRAASGRYPSTWCGVVKQPWQFSFVNPRTGQMPSVDENSAAWRKALGITRLAISGAVPSLSNDVLWYHADYVAPSWGRRLTRVEKIGTHIFYRA